MNLLRVLIAAWFAFISLSAFAADRPNVILIMTDDQGYGDFGVTGNPVISTPNLDAMAARSTWMRTFYVSPVCSPTRASLLTGRYNYRTRCIDTFVGRSMMDPAEVTLAEVLREAGYATGVFGKWHLGDCYPMRAMDQGFEESVVLRGGGLGQPSDPPENENRYTDPILFRNGLAFPATGYCSDIYFDEAMDFMSREHNRDRPFFAYIAPNAPHSPFHDVPEALRERYVQADFTPLARDGRNPGDRRTIAAIAAMITNIDDNVGRLFARLEELGATDNTLVIFLTDNGPNTPRFVGPFRGMKSEVYEGGIRSPFWMHWPGRLKAGYTRDEPVAHIDVMPTVLEACGVDAPKRIRLDGRSFWKLATGESANRPDQPIVIQTHRGDVPARYHQFMIRRGPWKLLHASGFDREALTGEARFELYDVVNDPGESQNLIAANPGVAAELRTAYDNWFDDVSATRHDNYAPPRIRIGTKHERITVLTRQDWRGGTWAPESIGHWLVTAKRGRYDVLARVLPVDEPATLEIRIGDSFARLDVPAGAATVSATEMFVRGGDSEVHAVIRHGDRARGVHQMEIARTVSSVENR